MHASDVKNALDKVARPEKVAISLSFFKTGKGQYGEGDRFIGVTMPDQRSVAKRSTDISFSEIQKLLNSKIHEHRLTGLVILTYQFEKANAVLRKKIYDFYLSNTSRINNWDLVDVTAPKIIGAHLIDKDRSILYKLAKSKNIWERRIAILSTFAFIREGDFKETLRISELLLDDKHDLIHKAVGWMLREVGKRDQVAEERFLKKNYKNMPRTMLRYALERFEEGKRKFYIG